MSRMPAWLRAAFRRYYLQSNLEQIALNRSYVTERIEQDYKELRKLDAEEALTRYELAVLS